MDFKEEFRGCAREACGVSRRRKGSECRDEETSNRVDRRTTWKVFHVYWVYGRLTEVVKPFYENNKKCIREEKRG